MTEEGGGVTRGVAEYMPFLRDAIEVVELAAAEDDA